MIIMVYVGDNTVNYLLNSVYKLRVFVDYIFCGTFSTRNKLNSPHLKLAWLLQFFKFYTLLTSLLSTAIFKNLITYYHKGDV